MAFDAAVTGFVRRLHSRAAQRCFLSGAFVLQVPTASTRFQRFLHSLTAASSVRVGARTHDDFQRADKLARRRLCGSGCRTPVADLRAGKQREYVFRTPLLGLCGGAADEVKRVMLWYVFSSGGATYMYLKLESSRALSVHHVASAASRYILKKQKRTMYLRRRENAYKDGAVGNALGLSRDDVAGLWPHAAGHAAKYDATVRVGREMFVPAPVVIQLLQGV